MDGLSAWWRELHESAWFTGPWFAIALWSSLALLLVGVVSMPFVVARIPPDYFVGSHTPLERLGQRSSAVRMLILGLKNALGVMLFLAGVLMLVLPGQGVLTMLVGSTLVDFPGKRRFELWLIRRGPVLRAVTWIREKAGSPPLELPPN